MGVTEEWLRLNSCCELDAFISIAFSVSSSVRDIWISRGAAASLPANSRNVLPPHSSFPPAHIPTRYYFIFTGQSLARLQQPPADNKITNQNDPLKIAVGREEENCRPSPHCLDLSRRNGFSVPPGRTALLWRYSFTGCDESIQARHQKHRGFTLWGTQRRYSGQALKPVRIKPQ